MQNFNIETDKRLLCVTDASFPQGVLKSHEGLHLLLPSIEERKFYEIPVQTNKVRLSVRQEWSSTAVEAEKLRCETVILQAGTYLGTIIYNFQMDVQQIEKVFREHIVNPQIDPYGFCVEVYVNEKDVQCMVRLNT